MSNIINVTSKRWIKLKRQGLNKQRNKKEHCRRFELAQTGSEAKTDALC